MEMIQYFIEGNEASVLLSIVGILLFMFIIIIIQGIKIRKIKKKPKTTNINSNEELIEQIEALKSSISNLERNQVVIDSKLKDTFQKIGVVRYNAVKDMGGNISFIIAILNDNLTGLIINSIHSRDGNYTYIKEVENGKTSTQISKEEKEALDRALNNKNYY